MDLKLSVESKLQRIKEISSIRKLKIAIYPFGLLGKKLLMRLNAICMDASLIIDNCGGNAEIPVISVEELKNIKVCEYLFVIASINMKIYDEIRTEIRKFVPEENIYDFYPANEE